MYSLKCTLSLFELIANKITVCMNNTQQHTAFEKASQFPFKTIILSSKIYD